jgi:ADP-ribose pyrophosphatase YjhB (NUDIX family)
MDDSRVYPVRPYLAVSAAIFRDGQLLVVRRTTAPAQGLYTFPGGAVETGETLEQAVIREVMEETGLAIAPAGLAGIRELIAPDEKGRTKHHVVILAYAARWLAGEPKLNEELSEAHWLAPEALAGLQTTEGLPAIAAAARALVSSTR